MDSCVYGYLTYDKRGTVVQQGKGSFSTNDAGFIAYWVTNRNKGNLTSILHPIHINSRWTTDQNAKDKTVTRKKHKRKFYWLWAKIS